MSPSPDPTFERILAACLVDLESAGMPALERACAEHPELAARLRRRIGLLAGANLIDLEPGTYELPAQLGDFELLSSLGAGGMGTVHRARQTSTGRIVAVKLVRPGQLFFPESRARFRREVELLARLRHPAVLPVLAVGEAEGVPWFAMELVHGASLHALLDALRARFGSADAIEPARVPALLFELTPAASREDPLLAPPASWRTFALRAAREIARALAYAHKKGVLHRDVKPSNVLLSLDGRVFLSDFGLASGPEEASLTRPSAAVGSLAYMAPEVLGGEPADTRSDVYGVGALLHELLTLHRPFEAESAPALVRAILDGVPPRPRRHAPRLGPDDEAVLLRALERDPARRYATADELVADLDNLLARRPTRARPIGPLGRFVRFARRRPALAAAAGLAVFALVAGPLGWELNRVRTLRAVQDALGRELVARNLAEENFRAALAAIGHVLSDTATEELADVPRLQRARLVAVERALELMAELERARPGDPAVLAERARLQAARGGVLYDQGRYDEALEECERAETVQRALVADAGDAQSRAGLIDTLRLHAKLLQASLRWEEAASLQREIVAERRRARSAGGGADEAGGDVERLLALSLADLAESLGRLEGPAAARPLLEEGHALAGGQRARLPDDLESQWTCGRLAGDRAEVELKLGERETAQALADESLAAFRAASALAPAARFYRYDVASSLVMLGKVATARGETAEAEARFGEAREILEELARDFPESVRYRLDQARALEAWARALRRARPADAARRLDEAIVLYEELLELQPDRCQLRFTAATALNNRATDLIQGEGRLEEGRRACERALELLEGCAAGESASREISDLRAMLAYQHALARCFGNEVDGARAEIDGFERGAAEQAWRWRYAADLWNEWILCLRRAEQADETGAPTAPGAELEDEGRGRMFAALRRAIELGYRDADELRSTPALAEFREDPEFVELLRLAAGE